MKKILFLFVLFANTCYSQLIDTKELQGYIGKTIEDFNSFYNLKSSSIKNNFGDFEYGYDRAKIYNKDYIINIKTIDNKIKKITVGSDIDYKSFFKTYAEIIESESIDKGNLFIQVIRKINSENRYFKSVQEIVNSLKNEEYDLRFYSGSVTSYKIKQQLFITNNISFIVLE